MFVLPPTSIGQLREFYECNHLALLGNQSPVESWAGKLSRWLINENGRRKVNENGAMSKQRILDVRKPLQTVGTKADPPMFPATLSQLLSLKSVQRWFILNAAHVFKAFVGTCQAPRSEVVHKVGQRRRHVNLPSPRPQEQSTIPTRHILILIEV